MALIGLKKSEGSHMAKKRAKNTKTKRKRTAKKSKRKEWSTPDFKKWPAPKADVVDEALERDPERAMKLHRYRSDVPKAYGRKSQTGRKIELYGPAYKLALAQISPMLSADLPDISLRIHASIRRQLEFGANDARVIAFEAVKDVVPDTH